MVGVPGFLLLLSVASLTSALERPVRGRVPFRPGPDLALVEGDVAVPVSQGGGQTRNTFVTDPSHLWSNGIVFYRFETFEWDGVEEFIFTDSINKTLLLEEEMRGDYPSVPAFIWLGTAQAFISQSHQAWILIGQSLRDIIIFFQMTITLPLP